MGSDPETAIPSCKGQLSIALLPLMPCLGHQTGKKGACFKDVGGVSMPACASRCQS